MISTKKLAEAHKVLWLHFSSSTTFSYPFPKQTILVRAFPYHPLVTSPCCASTVIILFLLQVKSSTRHSRFPPVMEGSSNKYTLPDATLGFFSRIRGEKNSALQTAPKRQKHTRPLQRGRTVSKCGDTKWKNHQLLPLLSKQKNFSYSSYRVRRDSLDVCAHCKLTGRSSIGCQHWQRMGPLLYSAPVESLSYSPLARSSNPLQMHQARFVLPSLSLHRSLFLLNIPLRWTTQLNTVEMLKIGLLQFSSILWSCGWPVRKRHQSFWMPWKNTVRASIYPQCPSAYCG